MTHGYCGSRVASGACVLAALVLAAGCDDGGLGITIVFPEAEREWSAFDEFDLSLQLLRAETHACQGAKAETLDSVRCSPAADARSPCSTVSFDVAPVEDGVAYRLLAEARPMEGLGSPFVAAPMYGFSDRFEAPADVQVLIDTRFPAPALAWFGADEIPPVRVGDDDAILHDAVDLVRDDIDLCIAAQGAAVLDFRVSSTSSESNSTFIWSFAVDGDASSASTDCVEAYRTDIAWGRERCRSWNGLLDDALAQFPGTGDDGILSEVRDGFRRDGEHRVEITAIGPHGFDASLTPLILPVDTQEPRVLNLSAAPSPARERDSVVIILVTDEPIVVDGDSRGQVVLDDDLGDPITLDLEPLVDGGNNTYRAEYTVTTGDDGRQLGLVTVLTDLLGHEATDAHPEVVVRVDTSAPRIEGLDTLGPFGHQDGCRDVTVDMAVPDADLDTVRVTVDDSELTDCTEPEEGTGEMSCKWVVPPPADGQDCARVSQVEVTATDEARNSAVEVAALLIDSCAPKFRSVEFTPHTPGIGDVVGLRVVMDEPLGPAPELEVIRPDGSAADFVRVFSGDPDDAETAHEFIYALVDGDPDGAWSASLRVVDKVCNPTSETWLDAFVVDQTPPEVTGVVVSVGPPQMAAACVDGEKCYVSVAHRESDPPAELVVDVTLSEGQLDGVDLLVRVGPHATTCVAADAERRLWQCAYPLVGDETDGEKLVTVTTTDQAGNVVEVTDRELTFDFTPPAITSTSVTPLSPGLGDTIAYLVAPSELLDEPPTITIVGPGATTLAAVPTPALEGQVTYTVTGDEPEGSHAVTVDLVDLAGNQATGLQAQGFYLDTSRPGISAVAVADPPRYSHHAPFDVVTLDFALTEDVGDGGLDARLDGRTMACDAWDAQVAGGHRCTHTVSGADDEGPAGIVITATDGGGNVGVASTVVTFDFTAPRLSEATLGYRLRPENPRRHQDPLSAMAGTRVVVNFGLDEPLADAGTPVVWAIDGSGGRLSPDFGDQGLMPPLYRFDYTVTDSDMSGEYAVHLEARDLVANTSDTSLAAPPAPLVTFTIDQEAPAPPDVSSDAGLVRYRRLPWGADGVLVRSYEVLGEAGAVAAGDVAEVLGYDGADGGVLLARGVVGVDGDFRLAFRGQDHPEVFVASVDDAGNASARVPIRITEWTASLKGKVAGDVFANPHTLVELSYIPSGPQDILEREDPVRVERGGDGLEAAGDAAVLDSTGLGRWLSRDWEPAGPAARADASLLLDPGRGRLVLSGGRLDEKTFRAHSDTWEWDGEAWSRRCSACGQSAVYVAASAFHGARGRVVTLGGQGPSEPRQRNQVVEWTGAQWSLVAEDEGSNLRRALGAAMAYDPTRGVVLLFGGFRGTWRPATWALGADGRFTQVGFGEPVVEHHRMAWFPPLGRVVLHGGTRPECDLADIQTWPLTSTSSACRAVPSCDACLDARDSGVSSDQTWSWDGTRWEQLPADDSAGGPPALARFGMAYDPERQVLLTYGSVIGDPTDDESWEFDGTTWRQACGAPEAPCGPGSLQGATMAWDPVGRMMILFGGSLTSRGATVDLVADTWRYDAVGRRWQRICVSGDATGCETPASVQNAALGYDAQSRRTVMTAGGTPAEDGPGVLAFTETWEWDGASWALGASCSRVDNPECEIPFLNQSLAGVWESTCNSFVMSSSGPENWAWRDGTWTQLLCPDGEVCEEGPTFRFERAAAVDDTGSAILSFGGESGGNHTDATWVWTWARDGDGLPICDRGRWRSVCAHNACEPGVSNVSNAAWDPEASAFQLLRRSVNGNNPALYTLADALTDTDWTDAGLIACLETAATPAPFESGSMFYDEARGRMMFQYNGQRAVAWWPDDNGPAGSCDIVTPSFADTDQSLVFNRGGGAWDTARSTLVSMARATGSSVIQTVFVWDLGPRAVPTHVFRVAWDRADAPSTGGCFAGADSCPVAWIDVAWAAGGERSTTVSPYREAAGAELMAWTGVTWESVAMTESADASEGVTTQRITDPATIGAILGAEGRDVAFAVVTHGTRLVTDYLHVTVSYRTD